MVFYLNRNDKTGVSQFRRYARFVTVFIQFSSWKFKLTLSYIGIKLFQKGKSKIKWGDFIIDYGKSG